MNDCYRCGGLGFIGVPARQCPACLGTGQHLFTVATLTDLIELGLSRIVISRIPHGTIVADRPDIELHPMPSVLARRTLPSTGRYPFVDWYPLIGAGRSRLSESDGVFSYSGSV